MSSYIRTGIISTRLKMGWRRVVSRSLGEIQFHQVWLNWDIPKIITGGNREYGVGRNGTRSNGGGKTINYANILYIKGGDESGERGGDALGGGVRAIDELSHVSFNVSWFTLTGRSGALAGTGGNEGNKNLPSGGKWARGFYGSKASTRRRSGRNGKHPRRCRQEGEGDS